MRGVSSSLLSDPSLVHDPVSRSDRLPTKVYVEPRLAGIMYATGMQKEVSVDYAREALVTGALLLLAVVSAVNVPSPTVNSEVLTRIASTAP